MLSIGPVETYADLQAEIKNVLSIADRKTRNISIACLIHYAQERYQIALPFEQSDVYLISIKSLCNKFKSSFLKAYFKMQFFYWNLDLNSVPKIPAREHEWYHLIVENPMTPETIASLMPLLNNGKERYEESRVEIYTNILFSHLGNGSRNELHNLLTAYNEYVTKHLLKIFFSVAAASPKALKLNLDYVCLITNPAESDIFIDRCLVFLNWLELYEVHLYVEGMINHRWKPYIQYEIKRRMAKTKLL